MRKNVDKHIRITAAESADWKQKAASTCMTESALIRMLMKGYCPKEKPDERFYNAMSKLSSISNNLNQLAKKANALGFIDTPLLLKEITELQKLRADIERRFLRPEKSDVPWQ
jgi:hypothetical protein